jgi:hypothetical protein
MVQSIAWFYRASPSTRPPLEGDEAALGNLPAGAFQHCEAARRASAFGWYIFPARSLVLKFDGRVIRYRDDDDDQWKVLTSLHVDDHLPELWNAMAPEALTDMVPPAISALYVPGILQVWSGLFVSTAPGWSSLIRPVPNIEPRRDFTVYEGIVETDSFSPLPLFVNLRVNKRDEEFQISRDEPLFMLQPIRRESYAQGAKRYELFNMGGLSEKDWANLGRTLRRADASDDHQVGSYGAEVRRRAKQEAE